MSKRLDGRDNRHLRPTLEDLPSFDGGGIFVPFDPKGRYPSLAVIAIAAPASFRINLDDFPGEVEQVVVTEVPNGKHDAKGRPLTDRVSKRVKTVTATGGGEGGWIQGFGPQPSAAGGALLYRGDFICKRLGDGFVFAIEAAQFDREFSPAMPGEVNLENPCKETDPCRTSTGRKRKSS